MYQGVVTGQLTLERWVELTSTTPARMFGLYGKKGVIQPGADADIVVYDPNGHTSIGVGKTHHMNMDYSRVGGLRDRRTRRHRAQPRQGRRRRQRVPRRRRATDATSSAACRSTWSRGPAMDFGAVLQTNPPASRTIHLAKLAEQYGFSHVWTFDSHLLWQEPYVIYSQILAETHRIKVGPFVTNPATRDWTVTASVFATLNEMYGNRTVVRHRPRRLGGARHERQADDAGRAARVDPRHPRARATRRAVEYKGSMLQFPWSDGSELEVWVAAYGPLALKLTGEVGDGFILQLADVDIAEVDDQDGAGCGGGRRARPRLDHVLRRRADVHRRRLGAHARPVPLVRRHGRQPRRRHRREVRRRRRGAAGAHRLHQGPRGLRLQRARQGRQRPHRLRARRDRRPVLRARHRSRPHREARRAASRSACTSSPATSSTTTRRRRCGSTARP